MQTDNSRKYARVIEASQRVRWDIDRDVIGGRSFDYSRTFLPTGLSLVDEVPFLTDKDRRFLSQVQGRTYAFMFGLVERFIGAKALEVSRDHWLGDQVALEALVRMTDEELKHQALFRRLEQMMNQGMPTGYRQVAHPNDVGRAVLGKSTWAVLALTLDIELFTQAHFRASIEHGEEICPLWKDVFLFHWREESQHAVLDELELLRADAALTPAQREAAVDELIQLVGAIDGILQSQANSDVEYFVSNANSRFTQVEKDQLRDCVLKAYRWQYITSGVGEPRFTRVLFSLISEPAAARLREALQPFAYARPAH
ncbi:hypothetical protein EZ313_14780 [Ramlibacter henchirensis]|uniref:Ferritin-like domain-containing protein n=1 Tax=Ramlibacter henchirensis TaxID=204072 RepID=A0A4Z0BTD2_9BURK|nr:hypothetical protein [Ramlibacter henchirensis]TFZ02523.1 hypothetical protein EZ313_14780 [Ramlibacter henchirensis]